MPVKKEPKKPAPRPEEKRALQSEQNYRQCCIDYLEEHGPTRRSVALQGMAQRYNDLHTVNAIRYPGHRARVAIRLRTAVVLQMLEKEKQIIRGERPAQVLSLPA